MTTECSRLHAKQRRHLTLALGTVVTAAFLSACNQNKTPAAGALKVLSYGAVNSSIYDALKSTVVLTVSNGSQKPGDYDLVVIDGDSFTGQQLKEDALIRQSIQSNTWVLALDVAEDDKVGLGTMLHASSPGNNNAYLFRQAPAANGRLVSRLIDFAKEQAPSYVAAESVNYAKQHGTEILAQDVSSNGLPSRVVNYYIHHVSDYSGDLPNSNNPFFNGKNSAGQGYYQATNPQRISWKVDHQITVLLDAINNPKGDFQHVLVNLQGSANPGSLALNNVNDASRNQDQSELAWIQTRFDSSVTMSPKSNLQLIKTSPETVNNTTTVTSGGYTFNLGFSQDSGAGASFAYTSPQTSTQIQDWQVQNTSGQSAQWSYASNTPYNGTVTDGFDSSPWFYYFQGVTPKEPNSLNYQNLQYKTESYWVNNAVSKDTVTVSGNDNAWYTDAWVVQKGYDDNPNGNNPNCAFLGGSDCQDADDRTLIQHMQRRLANHPWALNVDMSAVIPVDTASLTFSPNPAVAGQQVTATLKLKSPTPVPAEILIKSDKPGVTPEKNTYLMNANTDTLTFTVETGAQGCAPQSATIQAFYADGQNGVLTVNPAAGCQ